MKGRNVFNTLREQKSCIQSKITIIYPQKRKEQGMERKKKLKTDFDGFTLVELLIVITIISILAAMLLPALYKAKASAQGTLCASNMKQIGTGLTMYANDNKDWLPTTGWHCDWTARVAQYVGVTYDINDSSTYSSTGAVIFKERKGVLICPSADTSWSSNVRSKGPWGTTYSPTKKDIKDFSIPANGKRNGCWIYGSSTPFETRKLTSVVSGSAILADKNYQQYDANFNHPYYFSGLYSLTHTDSLGFKHNLGSNLTFSDGSVSMVRYRGENNKLLDPDYRRL